MNEIKVLDKSIYNRIAAGEVVERPLSIVKELIENSIDAGATAISVDVVDGGMTKISIADNGKGITPEDVPTAFLAHATSKIKSVNDLDSIATLGFRGEALPSIAAVAKVKMNTRIPGSQTGFTYTVNNGVVEDSGMCGCPFGTTVTVTELFDKIPARKKFLSKPSMEESAISTMISKLILANSNIAIKYSANGKIVYQSHGLDRENAIYNVYGKDFFNGLLPIFSTMSDITLQGFICKPSASKHTKSFQTLIVNGRYVKCDDISYWIYGCYQNYLMKRQYPAYVLYLNLPFDLVDVNVHPNKLEIRFANEGLIKKLVTDAVKAKLAEILSNPVDLYDDDVVEILPTQIEEEEIFIPLNPQPATDSLKQVDSSVLGEIHTKRIIGKSLDFSKLRDSSDDDDFEKAISSMADITFNKENEIQSRLDTAKELSHSITENDLVSFVKETDSGLNYEEEELVIQTEFISPKKANYVGKLFNTYLIFEYDDQAYFIDQHAAHERILYDKLVHEFETNEVTVQNMLIPYTFTVSAEESDVLSCALTKLSSYGFNIERYSGNDFSLKSVPAICVQMDVNSFLSDILDVLGKKGEIEKSDAFKDKLAQMACKAAIKGGDDIPFEEVSALISSMLNNGGVLVCPHGRPIVVKISEKDIEKWFKRIV